MRSSTIRQLLRAGAVACLALYSVACAQTCSNASLYGTSFTVLNGTMASGNSFTPEVFLDKEVYDGQGGVSGTYVSSVNGVAGNGALSGTYTVNSDCSGAESDTLTPQGGTPFNSTSSFQLVQG